MLEKRGLFGFHAGRILIRLADDAIHNLQAARETRRKTLIMRDHHNRFSLRNQLFKNLQDGFGGQAIQVAGGFVGNDQVRVVDQGAGNGHALLLPAGDMRGDFIGMAGNFDQFQQFEGSFFADQRLVGAQKIGRQHDVFHQIERGHQLKGLVNDPDVFATPQGQPVFVERMDRDGGRWRVTADPMKQDLAGSHCAYAGNHVEQGAFAGTRLTGNSKKLALADVNVDIVERCKRPLPGGVDFAYPLHLDNQVIGHESFHQGECDPPEGGKKTKAPKNNRRRGKSGGRGSGCSPRRDG